MRQGISAGDLVNRRNCRTIFADFVRQREAAQLGQITPVKVGAFMNPSSAYQIAVEGAQYTSASEYDSYVAEISRPSVAATAPPAPTTLTDVPGNGETQILFAQASDGGSPITNYEYSTDNGATFTAFSPAITTSPATITGLTNGTTYLIVLKAVNAIGTSAASATLSSTPIDPPGTPVIQYILAGDQEVFIYVTAGSGSTPTNYEYTTDNGATFTAISPASADSPLNVSGLVNGVLLTVGVRATNGAGSSSVSNYVSITPVNPSSASPLLYYDPSNSSSYSGTGSSVVSIGSASSTGTKAAAVTYNAAIKGGVFDFPGTAAAVISFPSYDFGNSISVTAWIYPRSQANINGLFTNAGANVPTNGFKFQWNWWLTSSRSISFQAGNGSSGGDDHTPVNTLTYDTWQHIGYVFDKTNQKVIFFLNGQPTLVSTDVTTVANINTNAAFNIGGYIGGSYTMNAQLGYIKIFNSILNATQIEADYTASAARFA
jgi:hypothetical protein